MDVNSGQFANASNYTGPTITDKTLVSWVSLDDLNVQSGSALTIDSPSVDRFDAIVYGEREPNRWMAGSSYFQRTQIPVVPGFEETSPNQLVQMAITYEDNGGSPDISIYRNGDLIGNYTQGSTASWSAGDAEVIFGARHTGGTTFPIGTLDARIEEAMIFDEVLTQEQIQQLKPDHLNENTGTGNFTDSGQSLGGSSDSTGVGLEDLDGDGDLDAFISNWRNQPNKVLLNNGDGTFVDSGQSLGFIDSHLANLEDLDGDGDVDAFVTNHGTQANKVWLNDGEGNFTDSGQSLGNSWSVYARLNDLDGDGDLDAFVTNRDNLPNKVWLNDGEGTFTDSGQSLGNSWSWGLDIGDLDGNGSLDAFVGNRNQPNEVWLNEAVIDCKGLKL